MTNTIAQEAFGEMLGRGDQAPDFEMVFRHPVLLWPKAWDAISQQVPTLSAARQPLAHKLLSFLQSLHQELGSGKMQYPRGYGPIETIYNEYRNGVISGETAIAKAKAPEVAALLSPLYLTALSMNAEGSAFADGSKWKDSLLLLDMMLASVESIDGDIKATPDWLEMWNEPAISWVGVALVALISVPDKRIMDKAVAYGEKLLKENETALPAPQRAEVLHRLGVLHLDPYFFQKNSSNYDVQHAIWQKKLYDYYGDQLAGLEPTDIEVPPPLEALKTAIGYLEKAVEVGVGQRRAGSLKALAEALNWQNVLTKGTDNSRVIAACLEALALLEGVQGAEQKRAALQQLMEYAGGSAEGTLDKDIETKANRLIGSTPEELIHQYGQPVLFSDFNAYIRYFLKRQPDTALNLYRKAQEILDQYPDEGISLNHYRNGTDIVITLADPVTRDDKDIDTATAYNNYIAHEKDHGSTALSFYSTALAIAFKSTSKNDESVGLQILDILKPGIEKENPELHFLLPLIRYMYAFMQMGEAVNQLNAKDPNGAIGSYFEALAGFINLGHTGQMQELLSRIEDLCKDCDEKGLEIVLASLSMYALPLEQSGNEGIRRTYLSMCNLLWKRFCGAQPIKPIVLFILLQMIKGNSFSAMLQSPGRVQVADIAGAQPLLDQIQAQFDALPVKFPSIRERVIDKDTLLIGFAGNEERRPGDDPVTRLSNLQLGFDSLFYKAQLQHVKAEPIMTPEQVQEQLDDDTVLWIQLLAPTPDGMAGIYSLFVSKESFRMTMGQSKDFPSATVELSKDGIVAKMPLLSFTVASTRSAIVLEEPDDDEVSDKGHKLLKSEATTLLGGNIEETLAKFKEEGKTHLCIWPHNAYHYFPFHLLPMKSGGLLSDQWTITGIPALRVLTPQQAGHEATTPLSVLTMTFSNNNPYGVSQLPGAVDSTKPVADIFGTGVIADKGLTEQAFRDILQKSKWVHLYTHGYLNVDAPAFHSLFLEPGNGSDGIMYAYEITGMDLRHIDLLTLCACESALGRFDTADNLRGLPAAFLTAGVSTIIGTLWDAETESAAFFFKTLYGALKGGASKRSAFKTAQEATRKNYPEYRDWGAFYSLGR